jgi:hypothetical protein
MNTIKITKLALIATATVAATIALPATAHARAGVPTFQSPSGSIVCFMNNDGAPALNGVLCYVANHTYPLPQGDVDCSAANAWGHFLLNQGEPSAAECADQVNGLAHAPALDYGQTRSIGPITCDSEPSGVTCTDSSTGHFFRVSQESYQLG